MQETRSSGAQCNSGGQERTRRQIGLTTGYLASGAYSRRPQKCDSTLKAARRDTPSSNTVRPWGRQLRRIAHDARRDPAVLLAGVIGVIAFFFGARRAFELEPPSLGGRFACETIGSGLALAVLLHLVQRSDREGLAEGPFHLLLATARKRAAWRLTEAYAAFGVMMFLPALALLTLDPLRAPSFIAAGVGGAAIVGATTLASKPERSALRDMAKGRSGATQVSWRGPLLVARLQWRRRIGPLPGWLAAALVSLLGALATALAVNNNPGSNIGAVVLAATGLVAGVLLASLDLDLLRFRAREPGTLLSLIGAFAGPSPLVMIAVLTLVGAMSGLPFGTAFAVGLGVGATLAIYSTVILLHALRGATRFPVFAAGVDLTIATILAALFAPLALGWGTARAFLLVRSARRADGRPAERRGTGASAWAGASSFET